MTASRRSLASRSHSRFLETVGVQGQSSCSGIVGVVVSYRPAVRVEYRLLLSAASVSVLTSCFPKRPLVEFEIELSFTICTWEEGPIRFFIYDSRAIVELLIAQWSPVEWRWLFYAAWYKNLFRWPARIENEISIFLLVCSLWGLKFLPVDHKDVRNDDPTTV